MNRQLPPGGTPSSTAGEDACGNWTDCVKSVRERIVSLIEHESLPDYRKGREGLTVEERAYAGQVLGQLGDRRSGVGVKDGLPDIDWIEIPPGNFLMGGQGEEDGGGEYVCDVVKAPYRISRYPITVRQYQAFVKAGGYEKSRYWTEAGWKWRTDGNFTGPLDFPLGHAECGGADFAGNVWEWCRSLWGKIGERPSLLIHTAQTMAENPEAQEYRPRVLRGGSWFNDNPGHLRSSGRSLVHPAYRNYVVGFRVVCVWGSPLGRWRWLKLCSLTLLSFSLFHARSARK